MTPFVAELVGTGMLIFFGCGVVANVILNKTKGNNSGWLVINLGWAMAVFVAVYSVSSSSGAHLNPAVTLAIAIDENNFTHLHFIAAQFVGAMLGASLVYLIYRQHFNETESNDLKLAVFATGPAIRSYWQNFLTEMIITCVFVLSVFFIGNNPKGTSLGAIDALPVSLLVLAIGLCLGGPTGYAINPARDLGPRIVHYLLPIKNKGNSDWGYSWIPVIAPICGALLAVALKKLLMR